MIYFTADLHFWHDHIIHHCDRPFWSEVEMNDSLIENWNDTVRPDDEIYILGDITMEGPEKAFSMLSQLRGKKYLVRGNHDRFVDNSDWEHYSWVFQWVKDYHELVLDNQKFILFHYPLVEWNDFYKGAIQLHGHQHNKPEYNHQQLQAGIKRYDVGVDANGFSPVSAAAIFKFFERKTE